MRGAKSHDYDLLPSLIARNCNLLSLHQAFWSRIYDRAYSHLKISLVDLAEIARQGCLFTQGPVWNHSTATLVRPDLTSKAYFMTAPLYREFRSRSLTGFQMMVTGTLPLPMVHHRKPRKTPRVISRRLTPNLGPSQGAIPLSMTRSQEICRA